MLEKLFNDVYEKFKLSFYNSIFKGFEDREASLTSTEIFCLEVINALDKPTIGELTEFMEVSQPNMAYRVSQLMNKGYIKKLQSPEDRREYFLEPTEKFYAYYDIRSKYIETVISRVEESFPEEDIDTLKEILSVMSQDLMPEVTDFMDNLKSRQVLKK